MNHNEEHEHNHEEMEEVIISFTDENDVEHQYALIEELSVGEALYGVFAPVEEEDKIMEAASIEAIFNDKNKNITADIPTEKIRISKVVFATTKLEDKNELSIFEVKYDKLFYGLADSPYKPATTEVAAYIKEIWVLPFPEGKSFANARALQVIMHLAKNQKNMEMVGTFHLRNYKHREDTD